MTYRHPTIDEALVTALQSGQNFRDACRHVGVSRSAAYRWRRVDPKFCAILDAARAHGLAAKAKAAVEPWLHGYS
ncbi:MAG: hypothetical protein JSR78_07575 [Proteobacteria bacterium]|nr:hypothetical protein [Pseudomonadota bacterium]